MCGSLDAIESSQLAIDSYKNLNKDDIRKIGEHLIIYGLFQALYVQQDSVLNLCKSIDVCLEDIRTHYPELFEIRQLRNKGIGHPSQEGSENSTHTILIDNDSIELFSDTETGEFSFAKYQISDCIEQQSKLLCGLMQKVIEKMKSIEKEHKDKYMQTKLRDCFPKDYQYPLEKIFQAINHGGDKTSLGLSHTKTLIEAINTFQAEIKKRGLQGRDISSVCLYIDWSIYPLEKLKEYFSSKSKGTINSKDARAYADSAELHLKELVEQVENMDRAYESTD